MEAPKILLLDIETAPNTAYVWGLFDQNINHDYVVASSYILCWSAKWLGSKEVMYASVQVMPPQEMLNRIHKLLDEADVVIHYNGLKFDIPTLNREFVKHDFQPPSPYKQVDMLRVCRSAFRFESNKLDAVLKAFSLGEKVKHRGFQLWVGCMNGDPQCWKEMKHYNKVDVTQLERLYVRVRPWIERHPNLGVYAPGPACPNCGSPAVQRRGKQVAISKWYPRYQCQKCGRWFRGAKEEA